MGDSQIECTTEISILQMLEADEENIANQEEANESIPTEETKEKEGTETINLRDLNSDKGAHGEAPLFWQESITVQQNQNMKSCKHR